MRDQDTVSLGIHSQLWNQGTGESYLLTLSSFLHVMAQYFVLSQEEKIISIFNVRSTVIFIIKRKKIVLCFVCLLSVCFPGEDWACNTKT